MITLLRMAVAALALAALPACTITETAHPVTMVAGEARSIAVIENPEVTGDYHKILAAALASKGFTVTTLPAGTHVGAGPLTATYEAEWSWDFMTYLAHSIITVYRNGEVAGDALYDAPTMGMSMTTGIYESTESKVLKMVDRIFPRIALKRSAVCHNDRVAPDPLRPIPDRPVSGAPGAPALFLPTEPFPPYRFVPGHAPHPFSQKGGYAYGERPKAPPFVARDDWRANAAYLRGCDFFNRGWWWEAHEAWESFWHVAEGRDPAQHALLKALIQLAASALNRERGHDNGAAELLVTALEGLQRAALEAGGGQILGLDLDALAREAQHHLGRPTAAVNGFYIVPR